jgi:hypothetical protein
VADFYQVFGRGLLASTCFLGSRVQCAVSSNTPKSPSPCHLRVIVPPSGHIHQKLNPLAS